MATASPLRVGDKVNVPGNMHGTIKFIGSVDGKRGIFAGVELASEFAPRGKNSGDVDGKQYFRTNIPGGGIFLPVEKAEKRMSGSASASKSSGALRANSVTSSPTTPAVMRKTQVAGFSGRTSGMAKPSFSQSVGPGATLQQRVASPTALRPSARRESIARPASPRRQQPRPSSPLRRTQNTPSALTPAAGRLQTPKTRPSIGLARSTMGTPATAGPGKAPGLRAPSTTNGHTKFSQSLRQSTSRTPSRMLRNVPSLPVNTTPLGPDDRFDEDDTILEANEPETTPTPAHRSTNTKSDRTSNGNEERLAQEAQRLKEQLVERDRQLSDQASSITEMQRSLEELSNMLPDATAIQNMQNGQGDESELPRDIQSLRAQLRDKNEKLKALSAEFDANRADFRSTIDTLEMASTETERVYEQRVEDLLAQVQQLQERNDDVDSVAQQFKQLEELVQELEEGLEESRRAEAEARSEVEFLRGEVERGKSELRRERERAAAQDALEGSDGELRAGENDSVTHEELEELQATLTQKDDEIRGLKTIIQTLQGTAPSHDRSSYGMPTTPKANGIERHHYQSKSTNNVTSPDAQASSDALQRQIHDLESLLHQKSSREEELQEEVRTLRHSANLSGSNKWPVNAINQPHRKTDYQNDKHNSVSSQRTIVGQQPQRSDSLNSRRRKDSTVPDPGDHIEGRGSPLKEDYIDAAEDSEREDQERRRRNAYNNSSTKPVAPPSVSETSTAAQWCEICEESGHDILNCANMIGSSMHREPSPQPEIRTGKDAVREGLRRSNGSGNLAAGTRGSYGDRPEPLRKAGSYTDPPSQAPSAPLPPMPLRKSQLAGNASSSNGTNSNRSSATPAASATSIVTPTKPVLTEGTGDQAGMLAGKFSGVIDPERWCALCERDGHESVDCPVEEGF